MNIKVLIILIFFESAIAKHRNSEAAEAPFCIFNNIVRNKTSAYGCEVDIEGELTIYNETWGRHDPNSNYHDSDVKILALHKGRKENMNRYLNTLKYFKIFPSIFCKKFKNLQIIDMSEAHIEVVIKDAFEKCSELKLIKFYMNKIQSIYENIFDKNEKLIELHLRSNKFTSFPEGLFKNLKNLQILYLSGNDVDFLPDKIFWSQTRLEKLALDKNKLNLLSPYWFKNLQSLRDLDLSSNQIEELPKNVFKGLKNLASLKIKSNEITIIDSKSFDHHPLLHAVSFSRNSIFAIDKKFIEYNNIVVLDLGGNKCANGRPLNQKKNMIEKLGNCFSNFSQITTTPRVPTTTPTTTTSTTTTPTTTTTTTSTTTTPTTTTTTTSTTTTTENPIEPLEPRAEALLDNFSSLRATVSSATVQDRSCKDSISSSLKSNIASAKQLKENLYNVHYSENLDELATLEGNLNEINNNWAECFARTTTTSTTTPKPTTMTIEPTQTIEGTCGLRAIGLPLVVDGEDFVHGTYPWMAVLIGTDNKVMCGGVLISSRKVLTAGHCIHTKTLDKIKKTELRVILGGHNLNLVNEVSRVVAGIEEIHVHKDWNPENNIFLADIAVLVLDIEVPFEQKIQPICLPSKNLPAESITLGTVIGYGKTEDKSKDYSNLPKQAETPIHVLRTCAEKFKEIQKIASNTTFCGGYGNGTGACTGDSGGGLFVSYGDVFYLRGIVSSSLIDEEQGCDVNKYSLYTNVTEFVDWIDNIKVREPTPNMEETPKLYQPRKNKSSTTTAKPLYEEGEIWMN